MSTFEKVVGAEKCAGTQVQEVVGYGVLNAWPLPLELTASESRQHRRRHALAWQAREYTVAWRAQATEGGTFGRMNACSGRYLSVVRIR